LFHFLPEFKVKLKNSTLEAFDPTTGALFPIDTKDAGGATGPIVPSSSDPDAYADSTDPEKLRDTARSDSKRFEHLRLLVDHIEDAYAATTQCLESLLQCGKITYDLLWVLFKPGCRVYTKCFGTEKPRCVIFDAGDEATEKGVTYYRMECRYLDYDGQVFGEAGIELGIIKFRGSKPIHSLEAFPLHHHPDHKQVYQDLVKCGRKFCTLIGKDSGNATGIYLRHCRGQAFVIKNSKVVAVNIDGRVAVDATFFREMQPNYSRPRVHDSWEDRSIVHEFSIEEHRVELERLKDSGKKTHSMTDDDFLVCCPTVRCFSFNEKCFCK
jgi:hypothetical protein